MSDEIRGIGAYERDQLIKRYTALLDEIEQYHFDKGGREAELKVLSGASDLMGATLGSIGKIPFEQPDNAPSAVMFALMSWQSVFARKTDAHMWDEAISELMRMKFGDLPEMLKAAPRKRNQHRLRARMMFMQLTAVRWHEFFKAKYPDKRSDYELDIAEAYGVEFDTLTKWQYTTKKYFGSDFVLSWLAHANFGHIYEFIYNEYIVLLKSDGRCYKELTGTSDE